MIEHHTWNFLEVDKLTTCLIEFFFKDIINNKYINRNYTIFAGEITK